MATKKRYSRPKNITTEDARKRLKPRREPYWQKLYEGAYLGYRRTETGGTWIARLRDPSSGKQIYKPLPAVVEYEPKEQHRRATEAAMEWAGQTAKTIKTAPGGRKRGRPTVADAVDLYLDHIAKKRGLKAKADAAMRAKAYILPKFKNTYLDEITTHEITDWRNAFVPETDDKEIRRKAQNTANRHLGTFRAMLNLAWRAGMAASSDAWRRVDTFKETTGRRGEDEAMTAAQIDRLLQHSPPRFKDLVTGLLLTGMRPGGEIEHITREQYKKDKTGAFLDLRESKTGPRKVTLSADARRFFDELAKGKHPHAPLFLNEDGGRWRDKEASRVMQEVRKKAKLPAGVTLYWLRHTYISRMLENGASVKLIADNCGTSPRMIEEHYWHKIQSKRQEQLDRVKIL